MKIFGLWVLFACIIAIKAFGMKHDWQYKVIDINGQSSDNNQVELELRLDRKGREDYAISGFIDIKVPLDDTSFAEVTLERSATGSSDYKKQPFKIANDTLTNIMNGPYAEFVMKSVKECAPEAPQFTKFVAPQQPIRIEVDNCLLNLDSFPPHFPEGFYRATLYVTGPFDITIQATIQIESIGF